jgi:hypothetical protein
LKSLLFIQFFFIWLCLFFMILIDEIIVAVGIVQVSTRRLMGDDLQLSSIVDGSSWWHRKGYSLELTPRWAPMLALRS